MSKIAKYQTKCIKCSQFGRYNRSICNYNCSKKGKERIKAKKFTMDEIKKVLENNIGCFISQRSISIYSREILKII